MERMPIWQVAVKRLEMPIPRFLFIFVGGAAVTGLIAALSVIFLTGGLGEGALFQGFAGFLMILVFPILTALGAIAFPLLEVQRSATKIEKEMHMFSLVMMELIPLALEAAALKASMIFLAISSEIYLAVGTLLDVDSDQIKVQICNTP